MAIILIKCAGGIDVRLEGDFNTALEFVRSLPQRVWDKERQIWRTDMPARVVAQKAPAQLGLTVTIQEPLIPLLLMEDGDKETEL